MVLAGGQARGKDFLTKGCASDAGMFELGALSLGQKSPLGVWGIR